MKRSKDDFHSGMKVKFIESYATSDPDEVFTLSNYDPETGKGWAGDENGAGWFVRYYMIEPVEG